jgi:predicted dithiol-disulfide oxidoreductase (DUF899 family)
MDAHKIVSQDEWLAARRALLAREKEFTLARDALSRERRALPWVKVDKSYAFDGPNGKKTLADLFDGRSQLIVYHFMFAPGWGEGCKSCSYVADHIDSTIPHLNARDVSFAVVSRAPWNELQPFKQRMGWRFSWVSSHGNDFNRDYHVTFTPREVESGKADYNYRMDPQSDAEMPGVSVFYKDERGDIFHTYSSYARGLDILMGTYNYLDLVPKGRGEDGLDFTMAWVRHHDRYGQERGAAARADARAPAACCES